jgi:carboxymethylenebutenolidase
MAFDSVGGKDILSTEFYDPDNAIRRSHAPWRRAVAAGLAVLFAASAILIGLICTTGKASAAAVVGKEMTLPASERAVKVEFHRAPGTAKRPTVLMLHGGQGWGGAEGRFENFQQYAAALAEKGFDAYLVYYYSEQDIADRKSNAPGVSIRRFPAWAKLVSDLTADVKKMPDSNGKVALVGFSNGGNLSAHATPLDPNIDAAVVYYGGVSRVPDYVAKRFPPLMIFHGEADTREPIERGRKLYETAKALGGAVEFHTYPGINHGFGQNLGTPAADDAFARTVAFLNKTLKGAD